MALTKVSYSMVSGPVVNVADYGAVGDGIVDDQAALQAAYNATPDGGTLVFPEALTYKINSNLVFNRPVSVDFCNSTLVLNNSTSPNNHHFDVYSQTATAETWTQTIGANANSLSISGSSLVAGDYVVVGLGTDPYDPNEQNWVKVCRVLSNSGSAVAIDQYTPYAINGTSHWIRKITTLVANVSFRNLVLDYVAGTTPDASIWGYWFTNVIFENIRSVNTRITLNLFECSNFVVRNIEGTVTKAGFGSHGRILSMWQAENGLIENIDATTSDGETMIYLESWCRHCQFNNIQLTNTNSSASGYSAWVLTGNSYDNEIYDYRMFSATSALPIAFNQFSGSKLVNTRFTTHPKAIDLSHISYFADSSKGIDFLQQPAVITRLEVAMQPNWTDYAVNLCAGVIKRVWVYSVDATNLISLFLLNSNNSGANVKSQLSAGNWVELSTATSGFYGSDYPFNDPTYALKKLSFYTNSSMSAGAQFSIVVEYWPMTGNGMFPNKQNV